MDVSKQNIYLISNGSLDVYAENTLVDFKNKLPFQIDVGRNEGIEVAISHLGISNNFKNITTPRNGLPSFFITNAKAPYIAPDKDGHFVQIPVKFEIGNKGSALFPTDWFQYDFEEKSYSISDIKEYFKEVSRESYTDIEFTDDLKLVIKTKNYNNFWIFMHKTMIDSFGFVNIDTKTDMEFVDNPEIDIFNVTTADESLAVLRKTYYKSELYYTYHIRNRSIQNERDYFLESSSSNILKKKFPSVIKVICENISPQIFNNTYSKDLVVFSPDYSKEDYSWTEFGVKQYVPISNTSVNDFSIKLVDEFNNQIQLLPGPATLIKMNLRLRQPEKKTFNVRLTSAMTSEYPDNYNSIFKVKLPSTIALNRNWRVALTSISNPNEFSTFLSSPDTRTILIRQVMPSKNKVLKFIVPDNKKQYSAEELVLLLDKKLKESEVGFITLVDGRCVFGFTSDVYISCSNYLLRILGYSDLLNEKKSYTKLFYTNKMYHEITPFVDQVHIVEKEDESYIVEFRNKIDLDYLKPNYMIVYSNIVSKSVIGGIMSNILKVVPIKSNSDSYVISDFKSKEYYELLNTEIDAIEINLRSHDGQPINFASYQDTILNLEFTNYLEMSG